jgi:predicted MFS family arabinose efflux permease
VNLSNMGASTEDLRTEAPAESHVTRTSYVWYVILLLSTVNVFNYMDRMALAILLPQIKADLVLSDRQLGLLLGMAFFLFYAIGGLPIARWADRGIRRDIIAIALATWSAMTALAGLAQSFWQLFAVRMGVGIGEAGCLPPAHSITCDYVPLERRAGAFAIQNFGLIAGMMVGMALAGWLGERLGWRWAFVALGLPGFVLAVLVRASLREPIRGRLDRGGEQPLRSSFPDTLRTLWSCRTYRLLILLLVINGFIQFGFYQWWPSFFARVFGLGVREVGLYLGITIGIGSGIGILLGGLAADKAAARSIGLPLKIGGLATVLAIPLLCGSLFAKSAASSMSLVFLSVLFWNVSSGPIVSAVYSVTPARMRATAGAITVFATSVLGFGLGPFCVGALSDLLMPTFGAESLRYALLAPLCVVPLLVFVFYAIAKELPTGLRAAGAMS